MPAGATEQPTNAAPPAPSASETAVVADATAAPVKPSEHDRKLATALAIVPGVAVHGTGQYALGHKKTALALLIGEGIGLALVLGGFATLRESGNSRYLAGPALAATVFGTGLVVASFGADLYGTLATDGDAVELLSRAPPRFESELGYRYVGDPHFSYRHFVVESLTLRQARFRLTPSAWFASDSSNVRYRVEGAYRLLGLEPGEQGTRDDRVEIVLGGLHHRYLPEHFQRSGIELMLATRLDLSHFGSTLRGSFFELGVGYGIAKVAYDVPGLSVPADSDDLLLAQIGFGVALRGRAAVGSEARVYYDHRHDDYAAGFLSGRLISGVFGKIGGDFRWFFTPRLGLLAEAQYGSAVVGGLSLLLREGTLRAQGASP